MYPNIAKSSDNSEKIKFEIPVKLYIAKLINFWIAKHILFITKP